MKLWHGILLITLILVLPLTGCGGSSEDTDLQNYLAQIEPLMLEYADISFELESVAEDADSLVLSDYSEKYGDLLSRFRTIECPTEAVNLRSYTVDMLYSSQQMLDEAVAYFATGDIIHYDLAAVYAEDTDEARLLAIDEGERLSEIVEQGDGVSILQIFLWILGFGVAVTIAMFVLELTLGVGFGIIAGITVAIGAIIKKIKGS